MPTGCLLLSLFLLLWTAQGYVPSFYSNKTIQLSGDCVPFAFADFDSDKNIEIYCASASTISILKYDSSTKSGIPVATRRLSSGQRVTAMLAVDLDADSIVDTVVLYANSSRSGYLAVIWGNNANLEEWSDMPLQLLSWPIATSVFVDSVELFGSFADNKLGFLSFRPNRNFSFIPLNTSQRAGITLRQQAFIDLTGDSVADIFLATSDNNFEILSGHDGDEMRLYSKYDLPKGVERVYPSVFLDVDAIGEINHVVPVCLDKSCDRCDLLIRRDEQWHSSLLNTSLPRGCKLIDPDKIQGFWGSSTPLVMKVADVNLDSYPDLLGICKDDKGSRYLVFFVNVERDGRRQFVVQEKDLIQLDADVLIAGFFDLEDNGFSDILVCSKDPTSQAYSLAAIENECGQDAYFFKVMVVGGGCRRSGCPYSNLPRGDNYPGASINLQITNKKGQVINMKAGQSTGNALFALQLPYVTLGLGDLPSFVEHVTISVGKRIPHQKDAIDFSRQWSQMIPNSQILVVPYPLNSPGHWHASLYINPSQLIFYIGIALAILCIFVLGLVIALQVKEKQEDENEKKASQQFRYDTL